MEMVAACIQILVAGYETTAASLGHAVHRLIVEPELFVALKAKPELLEDFIDENLRLEAPLQRTLRRTTRVVTLGGCELPANANLLVILGAANRDARQFPEPDRFDLHRDNKKSSMTFGKGIHRCLGAQLNRIESEIALRVLLQAVDKIELDPQGPGLDYLTDKDIGMWTLTRLPVVVTPSCR
jgi:cytochrome P450